MLDTTRDAVKALLKADPSLTTADRTAILTGLKNHGRPPPEVATPEPPRLVRRAEAARILALSTRAVDKLAKSGVLRKIKLPFRTRAAGFRLADIQRLISGEDNANVA